jgi:ribosomal-protein-alanine N-acetyltransferase
MKKQIICNGCGRILKAERQDFLTVQKEWGYFSQKDLQIHEFHLCEECYDKMIAGFKIPVEVIETTEVL